MNRRRQHTLPTIGSDVQLQEKLATVTALKVWILEIDVPTTRTCAHHRCHRQFLAGKLRLTFGAVHIKDQHARGGATGQPNISVRRLIPPQFHLRFGGQY